MQERDNAIARSEDNLQNGGLQAGPQSATAFILAGLASSLTGDISKGDITVSYRFSKNNRISKYTINSNNNKEDMMMTMTLTTMIVYRAFTSYQKWFCEFT